MKKNKIVSVILITCMVLFVTFPTQANDIAEESIQEKEFAISATIPSGFLHSSGRLYDLGIK